MKRASLYYAAILLVAGAAIAWILHVGAALPAPAGVVEASHAAAPQAHGASASPLTRLLLQLVVVLVVSRLVGRLFVRFGQPSVVGEMAAGILLGPSLFGLLMPGWFASVFPPSSFETLKLLSQIGVCLFMFVVGMDLNVRQIRGVASTALLVSHASIVFPYVLGVVLAWFLYTQLAAVGAGFTAFALFLGISMSITAFPVLARILQERGLSKTQLGGMALTCAAVDDVTAWSLLTVVVAVARASSLVSSAITVGLVCLFSAFMIWVVRPLLRKGLGTNSTGADDLGKNSMAVALIVLLGSAYCTEWIGVHALFGAFLAGTIMPDDFGFRHKLTLRVENLSTVLLLPIFFVFTGLRTQIGLMHGWQDWLICGAIIAVATLGKLGGSAFTARFGGMSWSDSLQLGALMNTRGLMELIALNIGYELGILSPRIFAMLVIMALVTTMMTGPLLSLFARRPATLGVLQPSV
jgi:Kef-type K+ transport system membrane component KefB